MISARRIIYTNYNRRCSAQDGKCGVGRNAKEKLKSHNQFRHENGSNSGNYFNSKLIHNGTFTKQTITSKRNVENAARQQH